MSTKNMVKNIHFKNNDEGIRAYNYLQSLEKGEASPLLVRLINNHMNQTDAQAKTDNQNIEAMVEEIVRRIIREGQFNNVECATEKIMEQMSVEQLTASDDYESNEDISDETAERLRHELDLLMP